MVTDPLMILYYEFDARNKTSDTLLITPTIYLNSYTNAIL